MRHDWQYVSHQKWPVFSFPSVDFEKEGQFYSCLCESWVPRHRAHFILRVNCLQFDKINQDHLGEWTYSCGWGTTLAAWASTRKNARLGLSFSHLGRFYRVSSWGSFAFLSGNVLQVFFFLKKQFIFRTVIISWSYFLKFFWLSANCIF